MGNYTIRVTPDQFVSIQPRESLGTWLRNAQANRQNTTWDLEQSGIRHPGSGVP